MVQFDVFIDSLAIGVAAGVIGFLAFGPALGILKGILAFLISLGVFRLVRRRKGKLRAEASIDGPARNELIRNRPDGR
jgi:hypothetical protein